MNKKVLISIIAVILIVILAFLGFKYYKSNSPKKVVEDLPPGIIKNAEFPKQDVYAFFLKNDAQGNPLYVTKKFTYEIPPKHTFAYAILSLFDGVQPGNSDKVYSEIPPGVGINSITNKEDHYVLDLPAEFEAGGGSSSMQMRLEQLIRTIKISADMPVYITIDGQSKKTFGGEGIEITQPIVPNNYVKKKVSE